MKRIVILVIFLTSLSSGAEEEKKTSQVFCENELCLQLPVPDSAGKKELALTDEQVREGMKLNTSEILVSLPQDRNNNYTFKDKRLNGLKLYLKGISQSGGIVQLEPLYIGERGFMDHVPVLSDLYSVGKNIFKKFSDSSHNKYTGKYHAKIIYHPVSGKLLFFNFIHRDFDSPCNTIFSDCSNITFINDDSFDLALSGSLQSNLKTGKPVEIVFPEVSPVILPEKELSLDSIKNMNESSRVLKWLAAAGKTSYQDAGVKERFIDPASILTGIKYSLQLYDAVKALLLYKPASKAEARVYYKKDPEGKRIIEKIVFTTAD